MNDEQIVETFETKMAERGFDPATIIALIMAIINIVKICVPTATQLKRKGPLARAQLLSALGKERPDMSFRERRKAVDAALDVAAASSDDECTRFVKACCL